MKEFMSVESYPNAIARFIRIPGTAKLICFEHVVMVDIGPDDMTTISLVNGKVLSVPDEEDVLYNWFWKLSQDTGRIA